MEKKNSKFSNRWGFVLSAVGSAVGMANVWGFPAKMGANGGGAFLLAYLFFIALFSVVGLSAEYAIGRRAQTGTLGAYEYCFAKIYVVFCIFAGGRFEIAYIFFNCSKIHYHFSACAGNCHPARLYKLVVGVFEFAVGKKMSLVGELFVTAGGYGIILGFCKVDTLAASVCFAFYSGGTVCKHFIYTFFGESIIDALRTLVFGNGAAYIGNAFFTAGSAGSKNKKRRDKNTHKLFHNLFSFVFAYK
jgi:hypothetical protein